MKAFKIIARIIVLPFILSILLIAAFITIIKGGVNWIKYGGEFITYDKDFNR